MRVHRLARVSLAMGLLTLSCGESSTEVAPALSRVVVDPAHLSLEPGETLQLTVRGIDVAGHPIALEGVTWTTSTAAVATVSDAGLVTANAKGTATIQATVGGKSGIVQVVVLSPVSQVIITTPALEFDVSDGPASVNVVLVDAEGLHVSGRVLTWSSTNIDVVTVADGIVRPVSVGMARVVALSGGHADTIDASVQRYDVAEVRISPPALHVLRGQVVDISATPVRESGLPLRERVMVWASSDPVVASINPAGRLTVHSLGTATITGISEGVTGSVDLVARAPESSDVVAVGNAHTCAIGVSGRAWCWGSNSDGQLGATGGTGCEWWHYYYYGGNCTFQPLEVSAPSPFTSIAGGGGHTCGVVTDGDLLCWGRGTSGELGDGRRRSSAAPMKVQTAAPLSRVSAGESHTCALSDAGDAYCWGANNSGQLGTGDQIDRSSPEPVGGGHTFAMISAGESHTCGVTTSNDVYCWGANIFGQLGAGPLVAAVPAPVRVTALPDARIVTAGLDHTCALSLAGGTYCWGDNRHGELGTGTLDDSHLPALVASSGAWQEITARGHATCGIKVGGAVLCWGSNSSGLLESPTANRPSPTEVSSSFPFSRVVLGTSHACGLTVLGSPACWGTGYFGELGSTFISAIPVTLPILP